MSADFKAGVAYATAAARTAAASIEAREDGRHPHFQAAAVALKGLADALDDPSPESRHRLMMTAISQSPEKHGAETCPECGGRAPWCKDSSNGHILVHCADQGCFRIMQ